MIARTTIEAAVIAWLAGETGLSVVLANQGRPMHGRPCATIKMASFLHQGQDQRLALTDPGAPAYASQRLHGCRSVTISISIYGAGALDLARAAADSLAKETVKDAFSTAGIASVAGAPDVLDLTELLNTSYEERGQFDAVFFLGEEYTDSVPLIEHVSGTGTFEAPEGHAVESITFEADKP